MLGLVEQKKDCTARFSIVVVLLFLENSINLEYDLNEPILKKSHKEVCLERQNKLYQASNFLKLPTTTVILKL